MSPETGIPFREVFDTWCRSHEAREAAQFADAERQIAETERRIMQHTQERWSEHGRQHSRDEKLIDELKVALKDITVEIVALKMFTGKVGAVVAAAVVVAGFVVKYV